jgi:opacity protein-like surface antigen
MRLHALALLAALVALVAGPVQAADVLMKPFVLAQRGPGDAAAVAAEARAKVESAGFQVVGSYQPYANATVLAVTSEELKAAAARTPTGGYGAALRVTVTKVGEEVQLAYTNPVYLQYAYRMETDLSGVAAKLGAALGRIEEYGPKDGRTAKELKNYHYMFGMQYFDDPSEIANLGSQEQALRSVEAGLTKGRGGTRKVYRIDLANGSSVFGVALGDGCSADASIMKEIDFKPVRSTAHLPYEVLVSGGEVRALHARFRIAINFPDLAMMGDNSFMKIMCAPDAIEDALKRMAGSKR